MANGNIDYDFDEVIDYVKGAPCTAVENLAKSLNEFGTNLSNMQEQFHFQNMECSLGKIYYGFANIIGDDTSGLSKLDIEAANIINICYSEAMRDKQIVTDLSIGGDNSSLDSPSGSPTPTPATSNTTPNKDSKEPAKSTTTEDKDNKNAAKSTTTPDKDNKNAAKSTTTPDKDNKDAAKSTTTPNKDGATSPKSGGGGGGSQDTKSQTIPSSARVEMEKANNAKYGMSGGGALPSDFNFKHSESNEVAAMAKNMGFTDDQIKIAVGIARAETGNYTSPAYRNKNNWGGMTNKSGRMSFSSREEGLYRYLSNIQKNYFNQGLDTVEKMQRKYCPDGSDWAGLVRGCMS